jgi:hypothetical protein
MGDLGVGIRRSSIEALADVFEAIGCGLARVRIESMAVRGLENSRDPSATNVRWSGLRIARLAAGGPLFVMLRVAWL